MSGATIQVPLRKRSPRDQSRITVKLRLTSIVAMIAFCALSISCGKDCDLGPRVTGRFGVVFTEPLQNVQGVVHTTDRWGELRRVLAPDGTQTDQIELVTFEAPATSVFFACTDGVIVDGPENSRGARCDHLSLHPVPLQVQVELTAPGNEQLVYPSDGFADAVHTVKSEYDECRERPDFWDTVIVTVDTVGFNTVTVF